MSTPKRSTQRGPSLAPYASATVAAVVLRFFLGGTMLYAGVDKTLLDPRFLQADGVGSIGETLRYFVTSGGPLAGLVGTLWRTAWRGHLTLPRPDIHLGCEPVLLRQ